VSHDHLLTDMLIFSSRNISYVYNSCNAYENILNLVKYLADIATHFVLYRSHTGLNDTRI